MNSLSGLVGMGISSQLDFDWSLLALLVSAIIIGGSIGALYGAKYAEQGLVRKILAIVLIIAAMKRGIQYASIWL